MLSRGCLLLLVDLRLINEVSLEGVRVGRGRVVRRVRKLVDLPAAAEFRCS